MSQRVWAAAESLGVAPKGLALVSEALALAMEPRQRDLTNDHDPRFLHPGRCAVILLDDLREVEASTLAAGALVETEDAALRVDTDTIRTALGAAVSNLVDAVPLPGLETLGERLEQSSPVVRRLALVERLDQLRHAHLWPEMNRRRAAHRTAVQVYLPIAEQSGGILARRYRWWCRMFGKRHLGPG